MYFFFLHNRVTWAPQDEWQIRKINLFLDSRYILILLVQISNIMIISHKLWLVKIYVFYELWSVWVKAYVIE